MLLQLAFRVSKRTLDFKGSSLQQLSVYFLAVGTLISTNLTNILLDIYPFRGLYLNADPFVRTSRPYNQLRLTSFNIGTCFWTILENQYVLLIDSTTKTTLTWPTVNLPAWVHATVGNDVRLNRLAPNYRSEWSILKMLSYNLGITHNFVGALLTRFFLGFVEVSFDLSIWIVCGD